MSAAAKGPRRRVRIGAVSYLNTRPLVFGLAQGLGAGWVELSEDVPARLARRMADGDLDVALLPIAALADLPDLTIVPGLSIATEGAVRSVLLVTKRPLAEVRSVALDPESRTSNLLARLLFADVWRTAARFEDGPQDLNEALSIHDAAIRMGDKALFEPVPDGTEAHDMGEVWTGRTGLPFVFAVWAARPGVVDRELYEILHASRREGSKVLDLIAADYTWRGRQYPNIAGPYLKEHIRHRLGAREIEAMRRFFAAAAARGLLPSAPTLKLARFEETACEALAGAADLRTE